MSALSTAISTATETNPIIGAAIEYANRGWPVFPCHPSTKQPYTAKGFKDATTDVNQISVWWNLHPTAMIGVPTGTASGLWVLDIDVKSNANGAIELAKLEAANGSLPSTLKVSTPSGGTHYYFKHTEGVKNRGGLQPGIDVRGEGGYVIAPGSVREDGCFYEWQSQVRELAIAPAWLVALVIKAKAETPQTKTSGSNQVYSEAAISSELQKLVGSSSNRNNQLNDSAFAIGQFVGAGEISPGEAETRLFGAATANGYVGKDGGTSARATIRSGLAAGQAEPRKIPELTARVVISSDSRELTAANDNDRPTSKEKLLPKPTQFVWRDPKSLARRECLYGNHLYRKFLSATFGAGGGGKSNLVIVDALAMVSQRPLLKHRPATPLSVCPKSS
jgi:hypothetical protein